MKILFSVSLLLLALSPQHAFSQEFHYGNAYIENESERILPNYYFDGSYSTDLSKSFLDLHGFNINAQKRIWKYVGAGVFFHYLFPRLSNSGKAIKSLTEVDIASEIATPRWGIFLLPQAQVFSGRWNLMNLVYLQVEFLLGAGFGLYYQSPDYYSKRKAYPSWLWTAEQRFQLHKNLGLVVGFFGHRGGSYVRSGFSYRF